MHVATIRILGLLLLGSLSACGSETPDSTRQRLLPPLSSPQPPSTHYTLADASCQSQPSGVAALTSGIIYQFTPDSGGNTRLTQPVVNFGELGATSHPALGSRLVKETLFGATYVRNCPNPMAVDRSCTSDGRIVDWQVAKPPQPLRLCQTQASYPRESVEGIGLTSLYFLERALQALASGAPRGLPPITMEILPHYISIFENESTAEGKPVRVQTYYTHNLAYFPKRNRIAVFPESARTQPIYAEHGHLWESAFGMAHEAGHHLEQQVAETVTDDPRAFWDPLAHEFTTTSAPSDNTERIRLTVRNAISEGFADIVAFYAIGGDEGQVTSLYRLGVNRNPRAVAFVYDDRQVLKIIDSAVLRQLLGADCSSDGRCEVLPSLTPHDAGAIVAHELYRVFAVLAQHLGNGMETDWSTLIRLSYDWLGYTLPVLAAASPDETSALTAIGTGMEKLVTRLIHERQISADKAQKIRSDVCLITRQVLPVMRPLPFGVNGTCPGA